MLQDIIVPTLSTDGGALEVIGRQEKQVVIWTNAHQGAICSTCPAGMTGNISGVDMEFKGSKRLEPSGPQRSREGPFVRSRVPLVRG